MDINELNKFRLDENITGKQNEEEFSGTPTSVLFDAKKLFRVGMTEKEFISQYEQIMAVSVLGLLKNSEDDSFDFSSISDKDREEIENTAKKYFQSIDKDNDRLCFYDDNNKIDDWNPQREKFITEKGTKKKKKSSYSTSKFIVKE